MKHTSRQIYLQNHSVCPRWLGPWHRLKARSRRFLLLVTLTIWCCVAVPTLALSPSWPIGTEVSGQQSIAQASASSLAAEARAQYEARAFAAAADLFEQAAAATADPLQVGTLLANAALAYRQAGDWQAAQGAIVMAQQQLPAMPAKSPEALVALAQVQDIAAELHLGQGNAEQAAVAWQEAAAAYEQSGNQAASWQAQLNQAQALQAAGFYRRSVDLLAALAQTLEAQPPSALRVRVARSLGEAFRLTGAIADAREQFNQSLRGAEALSLADDLSVAYRSLGDLARVQPERNGVPTASTYYEQAISAAIAPDLRTQAQLRQLGLWTDQAQWLEAYAMGVALWEETATLPLDRTSLYTQTRLVRQIQIIRQATLNALHELALRDIAAFEAEPAQPLDAAATAVLPSETTATTVDQLTGELSNKGQADLAASSELAWYDFVRNAFADELKTLTLEIAEAEAQSVAETAVTETQYWYLLDNRLPSLADMATRLGTLRQTARKLEDAEAEASILGALGSLYRQVEDWEAASQFIQAGLVIAQSLNLEQIAYELQAQLGQVQLARGDRSAAIAAYQASVQTLQAMRADVVAVSSEAQYSFQKSIEPIYRELATLLLNDDAEQSSANTLKQAREVIELLQLAELDNFFREACLNVETVEIDQLDTRAAVLYPILLPGRLDVVISTPNEEFQHFSVAVDTEELTQTLRDLKTALKTPLSDATTRTAPSNRRTGVDIEFVDSQLQVLPLAQKVYDWLIRPAEVALAAADTQTLVFVLDGNLRSIPMSVLYDGEQFLIEKYAIALTPGLQLLNPEPLPKEELSVIVAGLSEERALSEDIFSALPNVLDEVSTIEQFFPSTVLLNEDFNIENFTRQVGTRPAPVVHLATHGKFGSNLEDTFILTWDDRLVANDFSNLLLTSELSREAPIELLVLSACETATGDDLAVLGLAGIAMRSGARSTLASLWQVSDPATASLMGEFYHQLGDSEITKAEAIRQAQLALLNNQQYRHPYYWSPFVLVGNWL